MDAGAGHLLCRGAAVASGWAAGRLAVWLAARRPSGRRAVPSAGGRDRRRRPRLNRRLGRYALTKVAAMQSGQGEVGEGAESGEGAVDGEGGEGAGFEVADEEAYGEV